ncbi:MAG: serine/threonine-protein kinase, partial [Polyangiaceae bacterium]
MVTPTLRLVTPLGQGGMGSVWVADHLSLRTRVVVKFMSGVLAASDDAKSRFAREASAAAQVKSPHVVHMLDHGVAPSGAPYIVMEYLEGKDLSHRLAERRILPPEEVATIVTQVGKALSRAHTAGILHRDIKPENIFLCDQPDGDIFAKLLDFGIAKQGVSKDAQDSTTRTGSVVGTPSYMSPEQIVGAKTIDLKTDLWSLGIVAFDALTGQKPFRGETIGALAVEIHGPLPVPSKVNPALSPAVDAWFAKACARDPSARFASAKELAAGLTAAIAGQPMRPMMASMGESSVPDLAAPAITGGDEPPR